MIGSDDVDMAREQLRPQRILLGGRPQRGRAFCDRAETLHVVFGEEQIVRAGFDGYIGAQQTASAARATPRPELT